MAIETGQCSFRQPASQAVRSDPLGSALIRPTVDGTTEQRDGADTYGVDVKNCNHAKLSYTKTRTEVTYFLKRVATKECLVSFTT